MAALALVQCGPSGYDLNYVNQKMGPQARFICKGGMASDRCDGQNTFWGSTACLEVVSLSLAASVGKFALQREQQSSTIT